MQTKRILCLIDGLGSGGAERQMIGLVLCLKRKGYEKNWKHSYLRLVL